MVKKRVLFTPEVKCDLNKKDFAFLRIQYTPIIGSEAVCLYSLLYDYSQLSKTNRTYLDFSELSSILGVNQSDLLLERKKLEAVGLLRVFEKADNEHFIFSLNKPLSPQEFKNNSLLFKETISKIGEIVFERLYFSNVDRKLAKNEFKEVTVKYQDLFNFRKEQENISTPQEINLLSDKTIEEALSGLNPEQFVFYLTNSRLSPSQLGMVNKLMKYGFSPKTINTIIKYSYDRNNKLIVANHVLSIAQDLYNKDIVLFNEVESELEKALKATKEVKQEVNVEHLNNDGSD